MEFDEHEEADHVPEEIYKRGTGGYRYKECLKNHAVGIGGQAVDGCGEFMAAGDEGTLDGLKCAACNCHRNFHRKEVELAAEHYHQKFQHKNALHYITATPYYHHHRPTGYLKPAPALALGPGPGPGGPGPVHSPFHHRPLALPSTSRDDLDEMSNPSSSGGGGVGVSGSKKRFRTKFTPEQKERMLAFSEALGWRIQKQDEGAVVRFCEETGVKRNVLKVWMHNNKHTIGKKP
ncbi:hypothetical protein QVD17_38330 [Tagetes erecta]|uniref:ZF-HD dimerization-type domain-containing protein n=1 Tax=Tagetes erecta TaxID=13708 RepID=A0AAD8JQC9_TARER|nr:hypothetical protein QVD17_38330 [Tagetes erecta]